MIEGGRSAPATRPGTRWGRSNRPRAGLLDRVLNRWGFARPESPTREALEALHQTYLEHVPFENATKLLKVARAGSTGGAMRGPVEFWEEHLRLGSGGTCFSSTAAYQFLLRYMGYSSRLLFCQLPASEPEAHTALLVTLEEKSLLVDVGYALPAPVLLSNEGPERRTTAYYDIEVRPGVDDEYLLFSEDNRGQRFRYRFTLGEVTEENYRRAWKRTFRAKAPYMKRLALGRFHAGTRYLYKDPRAVYAITRAGEEAQPLSEPRIPKLAKIFQLPEPLLEAASRTLEGPPKALPHRK
jgi:arylamine N-acetyltransferase